MRIRVSLLAAALLLGILPSCRWISSIVHDGEVVARLGDHKLFRSEVEAVIPPGTSSQDSTNLAMLYINTWAKEQAFLDVASAQLSKEEKDVSKELESYRASLLRYRFEQRYINERLDTAVSEAQILAYYEAHPESFVLERPVFRVRFLNIAKDSPSLPVIRKLMSSDDLADVEAADSIASISAYRYRDASAHWTDAVSLAAEFQVDYAEMLAARNGAFIVLPDGADKVSVAYLAETVKAGQAAPLDFCRERIRDILISIRKHELLQTLEQDLIEEARMKDKFVIYSE